MQDFLYKNF